MAPNAAAALIIELETPLRASSANEKIVGEIAIPNATATTNVDLSRLIVSMANTSNISFSGPEIPSKQNHTSAKIRST